MTRFFANHCRNNRCMHRMVTSHMLTISTGYFGQGKEVATFDAAITREVFLRKSLSSLTEESNFTPSQLLLMSSSYTIVLASDLLFCHQGYETSGRILDFRYTLSKNDIPHYYIDQYETSYLQDGFLGMLKAALILTSWDPINEDWRFPKT